MPSWENDIRFKPNLNAHDFTALCIVGWTVACFALAIGQPLASWGGMLALKRLIPRAIGLFFDPHCLDCDVGVERVDPDSIAFRCPRCGQMFDDGSRLDQ